MAKPLICSQLRTLGYSENDINHPDLAAFDHIIPAIDHLSTLQNAPPPSPIDLPTLHLHLRSHLTRMGYAAPSIEHALHFSVFNLSQALDRLSTPFCAPEPGHAPRSAPVPAANSPSSSFPPATSLLPGLLSAPPARVSLPLETATPPSPAASVRGPAAPRLGAAPLTGAPGTGHMCPICLAPMPQGDRVSVGPCGHILCKPCARGYVCAKAETAHSFPVKCPCCQAQFHHRVCLALVVDLPNVFQRVTRLVLEGVYMQQLRYCANARCGMPFDWVGGGKLEGRPEEFMVICAFCKGATCVKCKVEWHRGMSCEDYSMDVQNEGVGRLAQQHNWKPCPNCAFMIEKVDGCNSVRCRCAHVFCYKCGLGFEDWNGGKTVPKCSCVTEGLIVETGEVDGAEGERIEMELRRARQQILERRRIRRERKSERLDRHQRLYRELSQRYKQQLVQKRTQVENEDEGRNVTIEWSEVEVEDEIQPQESLRKEGGENGTKGV